MSEEESLLDALSREVGPDLAIIAEGEELDRIRIVPRSEFGEGMHERRPRIDTHDRIRVALHAGCCPETVRRWTGGRRVHPNTERRLRAAVKALGLDSPRV